MHAHSTSATNPRNHHFSLHQKFKINRPFHPLFLWQLSIKFVTHRHEENTCMRMNLPNPRFFFPPFIALEWHVWIILWLAHHPTFFVECAIMSIMYWLLHIISKRTNLLGWGSHEEQTPVSLALGVVYLGTSCFGFSAWVLVWIILLVFQREVLI